MKLIISILLTIASALLYRIGGMGKEDSAKPTWIPKWIRNTKVRDFGCPLIGLVYMALYAPDVAVRVHIISFILCFVALTTYWDSILGGDNFYVHGAGIGLAYAFYGNLPVLILRIIILSLFMGTINYLVNEKHLPIGGACGEEMSRGAAMQATLLLY